MKENYHITYVVKSNLIHLEYGNYRYAKARFDELKHNGAELYKVIDYGDFCQFGESILMLSSIKDV